MSRPRPLTSAVLATIMVAVAFVYLAADDDDDAGLGPTVVNKGGIEVDERSIGRVVADETLSSGGVLLVDEVSPVPGLPTLPQIQLRGGNTQVNDAVLDNTQVFPNFRPFIEFTQSETSIAGHGRDIVAAHNTSANQPLVAVSPMVVQFVRRFLSGYSVSHDGGQTWTSGFFPPVAGSIFTFGDPSIDVDRHGNFY